MNVLHKPLNSPKRVSLCDLGNDSQALHSSIKQIYSRSHCGVILTFQHEVILTTVTDQLLLSMNDILPFLFTVGW